MTPLASPTVPVPDTEARAPPGDAPRSVPPPTAPLEAGDRAGPYRIDSMLARGGFGVVYRARDPRGAAVAVKVLRPELASTEETIARFEREVDAVAGIEHPSVARVLDRGRLADGRPYFAMELFEGSDLAAWIAARGALPVAEAIAVLTPICEALAEAHARGIIHRDVKASNVFVARDPRRVLLLDFGVAKLLDPELPGLTRSRQIVGTPSCMAPEQLAGGSVDPRTDVYALGVLAYHMLTGAPPFADESPVMLQHLHRHARRPRPAARADLPPAIDRAVVSAMAVEPSARPADPWALLSALREGAGAGAGSRSRTRRGPAVGVRVEVMPAPHGRGDAATMDELERALDEAEEALAAAGLRPAVVTSRTLVYARPLSGREDPAARAAEVVARALTATSRALVEVTATVRVAGAAVDGGDVVGGPLLDLFRIGRSGTGARAKAAQVGDPRAAP